MTALVLWISMAAAQPPATFEVKCRKSIYGRFLVEKFDDWSIVSNEMTSELDGVSVFERDPHGMPNALPDDHTGKGIRKGLLKLGRKENWIVCHHSKMKMVIEKKMPEGLKTCEVSEDPENLQVKCR